MEDKIRQDLKSAQLAREDLKVAVLRMLLSEIRNAQIHKGDILSDQAIVTVVQRELKKRKEAAEGFRKGGREESAKKEESEGIILGGYLPAQLSDQELTKIVENTINEIGAIKTQEIGKVIGAVMGKVGQSAEGARVSSKVREILETKV